jgi:UDP-GlcNAc:undecaprenyl-phosphate GlcNAc-1-phosphate transferase
MSFLTFRIIFLASIISLALSLPLSWITRRLGLVDVPGSAPHKQHASPAPLAGGLIILCTIVITGLIEGNLKLPEILAIFLPGLIVFVFGVWDDLHGLSAPWKLLGQLLGTFALIRLGVQIRLFDQLPWANLGITVLWMVGITNAYNFVDSMDGLANGLACLAAAFFMLVTFDSGQTVLSVFSAVILGACFGTYYFTAPPARFFLGDSGAQFLGFTLAGLAIAYSPLGFLRVQSWFVPIMLVGVPIFDTTLVVVSRLRRHRPVYRAGRDHTYHRLVALGVDSSRAVLTMHFVAGLLGCLAFIALSLPPVAANAVFITCLVGGLIGIIVLDSKKIWPL